MAQHSKSSIQSACPAHLNNFLNTQPNNSQQQRNSTPDPIVSSSWRNQRGTRKPERPAAQKTRKPKIQFEPSESSSNATRVKQATNVPLKLYVSSSEKARVCPQSSSGMG
uniref:Uncharacterized protein n=1 Tax=Solanum tuberosum TaxID=4113 RepID=M1AQK2_SOLTU